MSLAVTSHIVPLGDTALLVRLGTSINEPTFDAIRAFTQLIDEHVLPGMIEYVPAFTSVAIYYDPFHSSFADLSVAITKLASQLNASHKTAERMVEIPVCYGSEFGEDLDFVANHHQLSAEEVVRLHTSPSYLVHMLGFVPGFAYLGGMAEQIATRRRATPRLKIAAGSVGIAGGQTGIYPLETPGGWQIIGRTPLTLFHAEHDPPTLLQAGDRVRFKSITPAEFHELCETHS